MSSNFQDQLQQEIDRIYTTITSGELFGLPALHGTYMCMVCGNITDNYNKVCEKCEDPLGGDGQDD